MPTPSPILAKREHIIGQVVASSHAVEHGGDVTASLVERGAARTDPVKTSPIKTSPIKTSPIKTSPIKTSRVNLRHTDSLPCPTDTRRSHVLAAYR
jgi:hypothetical protein